jgi:hypothetical protein
MKEGSYTHVPWMVGITDDEGAFKASALMHDKKAIKEIEDEFERLGTCSSHVFTLLVFFLEKICLCDKNTIYTYGHFMVFFILKMKIHL